MRYITGLVILIAASMACSKGNDRIVRRVAHESHQRRRGNHDRLRRRRVGTDGRPLSAAQRIIRLSQRSRNEVRHRVGPRRARHVRRSRRRNRVVAGIHPLSRQRLRSRHRDGARPRADRRRRRRRHLLGAARGRRALPAAQRDVRCAPHARDHLSADGTRLERARRSTRKAAPSGPPSTSAIAPTRATTRPRSRTSSRRSTADRCRRRAVVPAATSLNPGGLNSSWSSSTQSFEVRPASATSVQCTWTATSTVPWLTFASTQSPGTGYTLVHLQHRAKQRRRPHRVHRRRVAGWRRALPGQSGRRSRLRRRSRWSIRSAQRARRRSATSGARRRRVISPRPSNLPGGGAYTYNWSATYFYGTQKTVVAEQHLERVHHHRCAAAVPARRPMDPALNCPSPSRSRTASETRSRCAPARAISPRSSCGCLAAETGGQGTGIRDQGSGRSSADSLIPVP